jgi:TPR repeat protein
MARWDMDTGGAEGASGKTKSSIEDFFELGIMYSAGLEVETDLIAAHKWFNLAAVNGNPQAAYYRQEVAREMSEADIAAAQRAAREWLTTH